MGMTYAVRITFVGNKSRNFIVDATAKKYISEIGLYEHRKGFVGFTDTNLHEYIFPARSIDSIEIEENK